MTDVTSIYTHRFKGKLAARNNLWQILCGSYFQKLVSPADTVIDIGSGYGEFINNINCAKKIAVDINHDSKKHLNPNTTFLNCSAVDIPHKYYGLADVIFMSNFLEHLSTKDEVVEVLKVAHKLLKTTGHIIILQPNIDLARQKYWDFIDHKIALNGKSVIEALELTGFTLVKFINRFLPFTTKSPIPQNNFFVKAYLLLPPPLRPFAGQSLFVAESTRLNTEIETGEATRPDK